MTARFQVIALSSLDPDGTDTHNEPRLAFPEAILAARELKSQGKAFRVVAEGNFDDDNRQAFGDLGALF